MKGQKDMSSLVSQFNRLNFQNNKNLEKNENENAKEKSALQIEKESMFTSENKNHLFDDDSKENLFVLKQVRSELMGNLAKSRRETIIKKSRQKISSSVVEKKLFLINEDGSTTEINRNNADSKTHIFFNMAVVDKNQQKNDSLLKNGNTGTLNLKVDDNLGNFLISDEFTNYVD